MNVLHHIEQICRDAGLGIMSDVLTILLDRETVTDEQVLSLTDEDVERLYDRYIGPAIDHMEKEF